MSRTRRIPEPQLGDLVDRVGEITEQDNHATVCAVLRWALRTKAGMRDVEAMCEVLGLDLTEALAEKQAESPSDAATPRVRPETTLGEPIAVRTERLTAKKVPPTRSGPPQLTLGRGHAGARKL